MYKRLIYTIAAGLFLFGAVDYAHAQLRNQQVTAYDYTGPILKQQPSADETGLLSGLFKGVKMEMDHSYSMSFSSIGGQYQNINMYTNTMYFGFSEDLTGRLDVSMMHSPFGGSFNQGLYGQQGRNARIFIRNAELNYELGENSFIQLQFRQSPNPYSYYGGYGAGMHSGFYRNSGYNSLFMR